MISLGHLYTDLSDFVPDPQGISELEDESLQNAQLTGYETGYQAGWEDAVKATGDESQKLTTDFLRSVEEMSFTYEEAYNKLSVGMHPLMTRFVTSVLPAVAQEGLHLQLLDQIEKLVSTQTDNILELAVSPSRRPFIEELLEAKVDTPFVVAEEPSLSDGQIYIRVNDDEREIDVDAVLAEVTSAVDAFFFTSEQELNYG